MKKIIVSKLFDLVIFSICISIICATAFGICITKCFTDFLNNDSFTPYFAEAIKYDLEEILSNINSSAIPSVTTDMPDITEPIPTT